MGTPPRTRRGQHLRSRSLQRLGEITAEKEQRKSREEADKEGQSEVLSRFIGNFPNKKADCQDRTDSLMRIAKNENGKGTPIKGRHPIV